MSDCNGRNTDCDIIRRASGQTSSWFPITRELGKSAQQDRQMTAQAGAILNTSSAWDAVDWRTIEDNVRRLQARIVKAVQQKKWNKVKALQHLLTHSASGKLLAVRRVTENGGKQSAL